MDGAPRRSRGRLVAVPDLPPGSSPAATPAGTDNSEPLNVLMTEVAQGDHDAFTALYDQTSDKVFSLVRRVVRDSSQAEEVTQEVFLQAWRQAVRFDRRAGTAMSWLLTLAHRRAVDRVRSAQARTTREHRAAHRDTRREHDVVSEEVEQQMEAVQVRRCLDGLTTLQRESVTLAYYEGLTYSEVGSKLDVPLGTVKTRMRDGLIRLRDCMGVTV